MNFLKSSEGGFPKADVFHEQTGPDTILKKHVGPPKYQAIAIQFDPLMPKPLFEWIADTLAMSSVRKNGAIITAVSNHVEKNRLQFNNALITEFGIPTCEASSQEPGNLNLKVAPEFTTFLPEKGSILSTVGAKSKAWLSSNFRLTIPGLDCRKISKIDALTCKQSVRQNAVGEKRNPQLEPARLEYPNLVIYISEQFAGTFYAWFQDMVVKGNVDEKNERPGTRELLD